MLKPFRPQRSRFTRLLASVLVVASLLGNGLALAQAPATPVEKGCCDQMPGHKVTAAGCEQGGKPCPTPGTGCDDQCLSRVPFSGVLPMLAFDLPASVLTSSVLSNLSVSKRPSADPSPGLRPPISA
jgi:hypothetical protein